ncbi:MAG: YggS family pyridoxal phosphate-dependent enzyme [Actinobacteria bacterium]|nr:YggS family pyridoxal phosphate-dependent enzyme [Actinomycetota bacterium]
MSAERDVVSRQAEPGAAIPHRVAAVRGRIADACRRVGRVPSSVTVVAVTKGHPAPLAQAAVDAGLIDLGESRVQEMLDKAAQVRGARWHMVGRLQSNKAKGVIARATLVHSLDRRSLASALSTRAHDAGVVQRVLVQVNVGEDPAKAGCPAEDALALVAEVRDLPNLAVEGLMTIPPLAPRGVDQAEVSRPHFARLRRLRDRARARWPELAHLSMGMSADFETAVEEGATIVRLGTVLFGPRRDQAYGTRTVEEAR